MLRWRSRCGHGALFTLAGLLWLPLLAAAGLYTIVAAVMTLSSMTRAAHEAAGPTYAARQLALAILLMPFLLSGVWLVPLLVQSDVVKWEAANQLA